MKVTLQNLTKTFPGRGKNKQPVNAVKDFTLEIAEGYSVKLNVDAATVGQIIDDAPEGYSFAVAHFGK